MSETPIQIIQEYHIVCDNPSCDYKIKNESENPFEDIVDYLNKPCPKCGQNLLTQEDYDNHQKILDAVKSMNEIFKALGIEDNDEPKSTISIQAKNGDINIQRHE